jgi:hypothetical protein
MDEFHGQGGSYLVDPKTGKRTLVERTKEPELNPQASAPAADAVAPAPAKTKKGE